MEKNETVGKEGKSIITVRRTRFDRVLQDDMAVETIAVMKFETTPAIVSVSCGATRNMGNFEFLRLDVGVSIPCYIEEISEVEKQASKWVDDRLSEKLDELKDMQKAL